MHRCVEKCCTALTQSAIQDICSTIKADVDFQTGEIKTLIGRLDILSNNLQSSLRSGAIVETFQTAYNTIGITIGKDGPTFNLHFPTPILRSRSKFRIARKSSFIEIVAPIADHINSIGFQHLMYPTFPSSGGPVLWNMPLLSLNSLPNLDRSKKRELEWLTTHTSLMFSFRERHLREMSMKSNASTHKDARVNFKDSPFSLFMHYSGLQGWETSVFGINSPEEGDFHILIFVSCLRLDLANHMVVLDVAILPLHKSLLPKLQPFLVNVVDWGLCDVKVDSDELRLWKATLPAWVERCRQWEYRPSCEYQINSQIPLSVENDFNPICSCWEGSLPSSVNFNLPKWDLAAKHAVRAAISPSFSVEFVEQSYDGKKIEEPGANYTTGCEVCDRRESDGGKGLLKCSRCLIVKYCSAECQRLWKGRLVSIMI